MGAPASKPASNQLRIGLTKDQQYLVALLPDNYAADAKIDREWVLKQVSRKGFDQLYPLSESIDKLVELYNKHIRAKRLIPIAEKRDAVAEIEISEDKMSALLRLEPAYGGKKIDENDIYRMLIEHRIVYGISKKSVAEAISKGEAKDKIVARGTVPKDGENAQFIPLLPETKTRKPQVREDGIVDFRDLGLIDVVEEGTPLMRRVPATKGEEGKDILGNVIAPSDGEDEYYSNELYGVKTDTADANILVATQTGQPLIVNNGVVVEKVISYEKVDLSVGNVVFDGSVIVNGDVSPGMKIEVTGDILVDGIVEAATLKAGGDIKITQSVIGHGDIYDQQGKLKSEITILNAEGSFHAKYIENVKVVAGDSIMVREQAIRCELIAMNEIIVGGKKSNTGHLIGGLARSGILIRANVFGSSAGAKTFIEISADEKIHKKIELLNNEINEAQAEIRRKESRLNAKRQDLSSFNPDMYKKYRMELGSVQLELDQLIYQKDMLKLEVKRLQNGRVIIDKAMHPACNIQIGKYRKAVNEVLTTRTFRVREGKLVTH